MTSNASTFRRVPVRRGLELCALLACAVASAKTSAASFCVDTPTELQNALTQASINSEDDLILLERGSYNISAGLIYIGLMPTGSLKLRGGYDPGCGGRIVNASNTVLSGGDDPDATTRFVSLRDDLDLDGMTFSHTGKITVTSVECSSGGFNVTLSRLRVQSTVVEPVPNAIRNGAINLELYCANARVENVQVSGSDREGLYLVTGPDHVVDIIHSTLADNAAGGLRWANLDTDDNTLRIRNSILWNNSPYDIQSQFPVSAVASNFAVTIGGGAVTGSNNSSSNPLLLNDYSLLEPISPAINSAGVIVPGGLPATDIAGNPRIVGTLPDRGARESSVSNATTQVVTNSNNSGPGSLRAAMTNANNTAGFQRIEFDIPGSCPRTITPLSALPILTGPTEIDGYTQPGSAHNSLDLAFNAQLCVVLAGSASAAVGVTINTDPAEAVAVRGLAFSGFDQQAILVKTGSGHRIDGNQFAGAVGSVTLADNSTDIEVRGPASDVTIGGAYDEQRNLISGAFLYGVRLGVGASGISVVNNLIGTSASGNSALGNGYGVFVSQSGGNFIQNNLISGNGVFGVWVYGADASDNLIQGNRIGLKATRCLACSVSLPNGNSGVMLERASGDPPVSGPSDNDVVDNVIAYNGGDGITIHQGRHIRITGRIYNNNGLGIDLGANGPNPPVDNSAVNSAFLPNRGLNAPILASAYDDNGVYKVQGTMSSTQGGYRLYFYSSLACDASGYGEGATEAGSRNLDLLGSGQITGNFTATLSSTGSLAGQAISAVARDADGNTSEYSACVTVTSDLIFADAFEGP